MNRSVATIALIVISAFAVGIFAGLMRSRPPAVSSAIVFPTPRDLPEFVLSDHLGEQLVNDRFQNGWDILFFGFTHCPDICPTTLYELGQLRKQLAEIDPARLPRIWLVTVDPERDTAPVLEKYLSNYGPGFSGITGTPDQISLLARSLGVAYQSVPEGDDYTMSHTAALFLVDESAKLVALFTAPHDMERIIDDYRVLTR